MTRPARAWLTLALLLTALVYLATLRFEFCMDDIPQIAFNPLLHSWRNLPGFFSHHVWAQVQGGVSSNYYRPLFLAWLLLNFQLFGPNPVWWHASTLVVHLVATYLAFVTARRVTGSDIGGAVAALIFGLHPAHIESVAWASGVSDSLFAIPFLASFALYLRARETSSRFDARGERQRRLERQAEQKQTPSDPEEGVSRTNYFRMSSRVSLALSLLLYAVALLCKEPAIVLPALVAAYEWLYSDARKLARTLRAIVPYLAVTAAYVAIRVVALRGFAHPMSGISLAVELLTAPSLLVFYLRHLVWPAGIAEYYDQQYVTTLGAAFFIPLLIVVAVASALWWWSRRWRSPGIAFAALWVIIPIVPTLKISTFLFREIAHDRYLYVPVLGFAMLIAIAITKGSTEASANAPDAGDSAPRLLLGLPLVPAVIVVALTAGYAVATSAQETQWSNPLSLYARAAQISPNNLTAVSQFAQELTRRGRYDDALPVLVHLTRIAPADPTSWFLLGKNLYAMRRYAEAEPHFQRSLALFANAVATLYYSAENRIAMGRLDDAETQLRRALQLAPDGYGLHEALATIFVARGNAAAARSEFEAELRTHPENSAAKAKLADLR